MDTYMHKTIASVASLEKNEIIRSQELMLSKARQKFLKKMIILGPKTAILVPQFCRILVLGPHFWWSGGGPSGPLDPRVLYVSARVLNVANELRIYSSTWGSSELCGNKSSESIRYHSRNN